MKCLQMGIFKRESKALKTAKENVKLSEEAIKILEKDNFAPLSKGDTEKLTKVLQKVNPTITKEWVEKWVKDDQRYFWNKIWSVKTEWVRIVEKLEQNKE